MKTQNELYGFYGTITDHGNPDAFWNLAFAMLKDSTDEAICDEAVRAFLDSRHGRHFADDVINNLHGGNTPPGRSIADAIQRWQGWSVGRNMASEYRIPRGMEYLSGFLHYFNKTTESK